jgi:hypothetical protein
LMRLVGARHRMAGNGKTRRLDCHRNNHGIREHLRSNGLEKSRSAQMSQTPS